MRVILSGYYGFDNAGDEALLLAITRSLRDINPEIEFRVLSGNPRKTTRLYDLPAVSRLNPLVLIYEIIKSDLVISGGGSLLQDVTGPFSIPYYLGIAALAKFLGKTVVFYAQGIGPVRGKLGRSLIRLVANRVNLITLRDKDSAKLLTELGVKRPKIKITADPVFSLDLPAESVEQAREYINLLGLNPERPVIGLSVRRWESIDQSSIAALCDELVELGYEILFLPFQYPDDLVSSQQVKDIMKSQAVIIEKPLGPLEVMGIISNLSLFVGMRLHSLIFSACTGTPFLGIAYDPKVKSFLSLYGKTPLQIADTTKTARLVDITARAAKDEIRDLINRKKKLKAKSDLSARMVIDLMESGRK